MATEVKKKKPAVNYTDVLERLKDQSKKRGGGDKADYIAFEQGDTRVRILPGHPNMDAFFTEVYFHTKQVRKDSTKVRCLNNGDIDGDDCPICDEIRQYRGSRDKDDKKIWSEQRPKNRFFMNALDRSDDPPVVKILACGTMVMTQLLSFVTDPEYGDITDPEAGLDMVINRTGEKLDTEYTVKPRRKSTPMLPDEDDVAAILGTSAKDTQLIDFSETQAKQFEGEPENIMFIWENGWEAFKEKMEAEADEDEPKPKKKKKPVVEEDDEDEEPVKPKKKAKPVVEDEDDEDEEPVKPVKKKAKPAPVEEDEEEEAPKPKKKKPAAPVEDEDEDEEPAPKPKKKAKPAPVEEEDDEDDEVPAKPVKKKAKAAPVEDDDDDDLASLDAALAKTRAKVKK